MRIFRLTALWPLFAIPSIAADINSPVTDQPTIKSEIARGISAADTCKFANLSSPLDMSTCVFSADAANKQRHSSYKPFELGLFFGAWFHQDTFTTVAAKLPTNEVAQNGAGVAQEIARSMFEVFRNIQNELQLDDAQLLDCTPMNAMGKERTAQRISFWSAQVQAR